MGNRTLNWSTSSTIWGKPAIGSGLLNGKKEASRTRGKITEPCDSRLILTHFLEENDFPGTKGSGALAASSEADPWGRAMNGGPWNTETSPTTTHSTTGSTSPVRLRSSNPNNVSTDMNIPSSYFPTAHPTAIGQGPSTSFQTSLYSDIRDVRSQPVKSNLNPASGSFKNPSSFGSFSIDGPKDASGMNPSFDVDQSPRTVRMDPRGAKNTGYPGMDSRESSLPPSRQSESALSAASGNPPFGGPTSYTNYSHTPNNSISLHRPSFPTPSQAFSPPNNGRSYTDSTLTNTTQTSELSQNLGRFSFSEKPTANGRGSQSPASNDQTYALQNTYSNYDFQPFPQNNAYGGMADMSKRYGSSTPDGYPEQPFAHQYAFRVPRTGERGSNSPASSDYRRGMATPYCSTGGTPPIDAMDQYRPTSRDPRAQANGDSVAYIDRKLQRLHLSQAQAQQSFYPYAPQFQNQYSTHTYDHSNQHFAQIPNYRFDLPVPAYIPNGPVPRGPARDQDVGHGVRSLLLDEFRSNSKSNKRYELKVCLGFCSLVNFY